MAPRESCGICESNMSKPDVSREIAMLLAQHAKGIRGTEEVLLCLSGCATTANLAEVEKLIPSEFIEPLREVLSDKQCLEPESSPFNIQASYCAKVASVLLPTVTKELFSVICLPSFEVEWALRLDRIGKSDFSLTLTVAQEPIFGSQGGSAGKTIDYEARLSSELAQKGLRVWEFMIKRAK